MSPPRIVFFLTIAIGLPTFLTFLSLLHSHPTDKLTPGSETRSSNGLLAFFAFHTPSALFPPSAVISLTDDNSTFFLARPADFGPSLPSNGLSGPVWIGSGFGEDVFGRSGAGNGAEGELGCSDVPGWDESILKKPATPYMEKEGSDRDAKHSTQGSRVLDQRGSGVATGMEDSTAEDGTDDHLHHPLSDSAATRSVQPGQAPVRESDRTGHADIQTLQESAEINGKVALLSRGGCGFLEKAKWAQRRGATALIVGDHTRGGALVTMYARGDTSNISIPSLFTSHTTAHLLSSLIPVEIEDDDVDRSRQHSAVIPLRKLGADAVTYDSRPTFTPLAGFTASDDMQALSKRSRPVKAPTSSMDTSAGQQQQHERHGIGASIRKLFTFHDHGLEKGQKSDRWRPPSSGRLDWFGERHKESSQDLEQSSAKTIARPKNTLDSGKKAHKANTHSNKGDDFVIGEQDWRDPDLVNNQPGKSATGTVTQSSTSISPVATGQARMSAATGNSEDGSPNAFAGGSITPGSGEYANLGANTGKVAHSSNSQSGAKARLKSVIGMSGQKSDTGHPSLPETEHEGLWVTLTPTAMSTSPFFDTLLVLLVSPLVTLTVVYALLLLRSRIRRRRWRAPRSVVDRLPVRTYHTMAPSSASSSVRYVSPQGSSPTSPLLQSSTRSISRRLQHQPATASGIGEAVSASLDRATVQADLHQDEKVVSSGKKRKTYKGRQVECVVCLEEFVDAESQVMSLPCGHDFHADCITPWLTTRRRTCPICKNDVVRSMTQTLTTTSPIHSSHAPETLVTNTGPEDSTATTIIPTYTSPNANSDAIMRPSTTGTEDLQSLAAHTRNTSPTAAIPIPRDLDLDLELGDPDDLASTLVNDPHPLSPFSGDDDDEIPSAESSTSYRNGNHRRRRQRSRWATLTDMSMSLSLGAFSGAAGSTGDARGSRKTTRSNGNGNGNGSNGPETNNNAANRDGSHPPSPDDHRSR